ncbi:hypothetical protein GGI05_006282, partial [Coemansia sp. RSA 2603]
MWSVGCILGELLIHRPFLPGNSEQEQMRLIGDMIGAPNERIWPGFSSLPLARSIKFSENRYNNLKLAVRNVSTNTVMLLNALLTYDPRRRINVQSALDHAYFFELPAAMTIIRFSDTITSNSSYARHILTSANENDTTNNNDNSTKAPVDLKPTMDITLKQLDSYKDEFDADIKNRLATLTISREAYGNALENRDVYLAHPPVFSNKLAIDAPITNQKSSG